MRFVVLILGLSLLAANAFGHQRRYDGDKVLAVKVDSTAQWKSVLDVLHQYLPTEDVDVWREPSRMRPAYVRIPRQYLDVVTRRLTKLRIEYHSAIDNVQSLISASSATSSSRQNRADIVGTFARYDEIIQWMMELRLSHPEIAGTFSIGNTYEGRPMQVLRLGVPGLNKWKVWLDAGIHAREWIAPSTAIYVVDQLIKGWDNNDPEVILFLEKIDFHILPVANPDGYEYTHTTDRLWRKNRRINDNSTCLGVDLNRNFGFEWGGEGTSTDPCSNVYLGAARESEVETQHIVNHILAQADSFIMYHAYHSWGKQFFTRWDYTAAEVPPDHQELIDLAWTAVNAINAVNNETYEAGTAPNLMYTFSGSSSDWSRGVAQIKFPFLQELRDDGDYAFVPPDSEIVPCGEENWAGFVVLLRYIVTNYGDVEPPARHAVPGDLGPMQNAGRDVRVLSRASELVDDHMYN